jgi:hypothetical protein
MTINDVIPWARGLNMIENSHQPICMIKAKCHHQHVKRRVLIYKLLNERMQHVWQYASVLQEIHRTTMITVCFEFKRHHIPNRTVISSRSKECSPYLINPAIKIVKCCNAISILIASNLIFPNIGLFLNDKSRNNINNADLLPRFIR